MTLPPEFPCQAVVNFSSLSDSQEKGRLFCSKKTSQETTPESGQVHNPRGVIFSLSQYHFRAAVLQLEFYFA